MYLYLNIILFILVILVSFYIYKRTEMYKPTSLSPHLKQELYNMMKIVDKICNDHDIPYFVIGGTLLGSVRHKELIPWDYDIDIGVMEEDLPRLNQIDFSKYGLKSEHILTGKGKIFYQDRYDSNVNYESVFVDIFGYKRMGEYSEKGEKIDFSFEPARKYWPTEYFYEKELFPLKNNYVFSDMVLLGPSEYIPYCRRAWGDDWRTPKQY